MTAVNDLVTKFSFSGKLSPLMNFNTSLGKSIKLLSVSTVAVTAFAAATSKMVIDISKANNELIQLSRITKVPIGNIQALGFAATQSGSSMEAVQGTIKGLSNSIAQASLFGSDDFARLGISVVDSNGKLRDTVDVLGDVIHSLRRFNLSQTQQQTLASSLGIDPTLIQLMGKSNGEISKLIKRGKALGVLNKDQARKMNDLNKSVFALKFGFSSLQNSLAVAFSPLLTKISNQFLDFLTSNKKLISQGLDKFVRISSDVISSVVRMSPLIGNVIKLFAAWKVATFALNVVMRANPVGLIVTAITAAVLAIDDLIVATKGGKSAIKDFFQSFLGVNIVPFIKSTFKEIELLFSGFVNVLKNFGKLIGDVFTLNLKKGFSDLLNFIKSIGSFLNTLIIRPFSKLFSSFGLGGTPATPALTTPTLPTGVGGSSVMTNRTQNNNVANSININIMGAADPKAVADQTVNSLQQQLRTVNIQYANRGF